MQNGHAQNGSATGLAGRLVDALGRSATPYRAAMYSLSGNRKITDHPVQVPLFVDKHNGITQLSDYDSLRQEVHNMTGERFESMFAETFARVLDSGLKDSIKFGEALTAATLTTNFAQIAVNKAKGQTHLGKQLEQVAKLIKVQNATANDERALYITDLAGWDTHDDATGTHVAWQLHEVNTALKAFEQEMKVQGVWNDVVVVAVSEFGRTLGSNGQGTDHAWGGNTFIAGGGVRGAKMLGKFPDSLKDTGDDILENGRVVPTRSWEAVWNGVAEWLGVEQEHLPFVLPNAANFGSNLWKAADFFEPN
jgi:uncharacterized protein (DUF1501 family)